MEFPVFSQKSKVLLGAKETSRAGKSVSRVESKYFFSVSVSVSFFMLPYLHFFPPYSFIWHPREASFDADLLLKYGSEEKGSSL
jgi:hypothetical protein